MQLSSMSSARAGMTVRVMDCGGFKIFEDKKNIGYTSFYFSAFPIKMSEPLSSLLESSWAPGSPVTRKTWG